MNSIRLIVTVALATILTTGPFLPGTALAQSKSKEKPAASQTATPFDLQKSRELVMELPEVKAWQEKRREETARNPDAPPAGGVLTGQRLVKGTKHWAVTFYENPQTEAKKWAVFFVRASDGKVFVESEPGKLLSLEDWRKTRPAV